MVRIFRTHDEPLDISADSLRNASLDGISLHRCLLNNIDADGADFSACDCRSAEMTASVFRNANFSHAILVMVEGKRSCFDGCVFHVALVIRSDFGSSSFQGADFTGVTMKEVNFAYCDLRGAILDCEGLETCCFDHAIYDENTVWNKEFNAMESGAINKEINDTRIKEIEKRCNKATEGPWISFAEGRDHTCGSNFIKTAGDDIEMIGALVDDQDFIANARGDIPWLIDQVRRLEKMLNDMRCRR